MEEDTELSLSHSHSTQPPLIPASDSPSDEDEFDPMEASPTSMSITSSVYAYTYENGRRFHSYKHGRYPIPNDDIEQEREDMKHAMMMELTDGQLFYAPIGDHPRKILDVGTGTGRSRLGATYICRDHS